MDANRRFKIAVLGSASERDDSFVGLQATRIGVAVARREGVLLTGGCLGFPHAAVRGAKSAGGLTIAVSPAMNCHEHAETRSYPVDSDVIIFTGMGKKGRNVVLVRSSDACVFVAGGMGTLNEFTIAFDELGPESVIAVLSGSGGFSDDFPLLAARVQRPSFPHLVVESDPEVLVDRVYRHLLGVNNHLREET